MNFLTILGNLFKTRFLIFRRLNGSVEAVDEFRRNLTRLKPELENLIEFGGTKVVEV